MTERTIAGHDEVVVKVASYETARAVFGSAVHGQTATPLLGGVGPSGCR